MSSTSENGYWLTPYWEGEADTPMSASTARWYLENGRHLLDESSQMRVNWVALSVHHLGVSTSETTNRVGIYWPYSENWFHVITHVFPISMIGSNNDQTAYNQPINLAISLAGYTENSAELFFRAVLQPADRSKSDDFDNNTCLAYFEDSTTSNTPEWIIDDITTGQYDSFSESAIKPEYIEVTEYDGSNYNVDMYLVRLSIYAKGGYVSGGDDACHLVGLTVREYQAL